MRILQIRFKNLNSLIGEWTVDLTHPAFVADGIFAITGPTGSGKTTILDAICLALYGCTPRLNKVSKGGNEIMSRQTGECYAEVSFQTPVGRYRCCWSQRRARKKPDGELQAPKHEIVEADTGKVLSAQIKGVADEVERVTGMDFDRFTRSMLLAQGRFAAFLQAESDERAPILEQITGTEIYSHISMTVHARRTTERNELDKLQAELGGLQLLSSAEEQHFLDSLEQIHQQDIELTRQLAEKNQAIVWLEGLARLERELREIEQSKAALRVRVEAFATEQERLRLGNKALELAAGYAELSALRRDQDTDRSSLLEHQQSLPIREEALKLATESERSLSERLANARSELQLAQPILRAVRELDLRLASKRDEIMNVDARIKALQNELDHWCLKKQADERALGEHKARYQELQLQLTTARADAHLVEHLSGLQRGLDGLKVLANQLSSTEEKARLAHAQLGQGDIALQAETVALEKAQADLECARSALVDKQTERLNLLADEDVATWRNHQLLWNGHGELIAKTLDAAKSVADGQKLSIKLDSELATLNADVTALEQMLSEQTKRQALLETDIALLEDQFLQLKKFKANEEARTQLRDGEPCPLCGSKDHPYAEGNVPIPDETWTLLANKKNEQKTIIEELTANRVKLAVTRQGIEQTSLDQATLAQQISERVALIQQNCLALVDELPLQATDPELGEKLKQLEKMNAERLCCVTDKLNKLDVLDRELMQGQNALEQVREVFANRERDTKTASNARNMLEQKLEQLQAESNRWLEQWNQSLFMLEQQLAPFELAALRLENIDSIGQELVLRRDRWVAMQKENADLEGKQGKLEIQIQHQTDTIARSDAELHKLQGSVCKLQEEWEALAQRRHELFGEKQPDEEEKRLASAVDFVEQELNTARSKTTGVTHELVELQAKIRGLESSIAVRLDKLTSAEQQFEARRQAADFASEEVYLASVLPEAERNRLSQQQHELTREKTELSAKEREKRQLQDSEKQKNITGEPLTSLQHAVRVLVEKQVEVQQALGAIKQKLNDNDKLKQQQQQRIQVIRLKKRECEKWDRLHELIGSADGKKFRNFAQGITFEIMIGHANRRLQKMNDRYLLIRDKEKPLELSVIDNYQAGEIRTTKNLSGGESFIVSLALALGLANMASQKVRVDSLFLDEGFGTLDEEALDVALDTLSNLQQDGKLIGIISHVPALKERISTHIQVVPYTGGRSRIDGPGCSANGTD